MIISQKNFQIFFPFKNKIRNVLSWVEQAVRLLGGPRDVIDDGVHGGCVRRDTLFSVLVLQICITYFLKQGTKISSMHLLFRNKYWNLAQLDYSSSILKTYSIKIRIFKFCLKSYYLAQKQNENMFSKTYFSSRKLFYRSKLIYQKESLVFKRNESFANLRKVDLAVWAEDRSKSGRGTLAHFLLNLNSVFLINRE